MPAWAIVVLVVETLTIAALVVIFLPRSKRREQNRADEVRHLKTRIDFVTSRARTPIVVIFGGEQFGPGRSVYAVASNNHKPDWLIRDEQAQEMGRGTRQMTPVEVKELGLPRISSITHVVIDNKGLITGVPMP